MTSTGDTTRTGSGHGRTAWSCGLAVVLVLWLLALPAATEAAALDPRYATQDQATLPESLEADEQGGIDWPSAAVGAGAVMSIVAIGGAGLLTVRRRSLDRWSIGASPERDLQTRRRRPW